MARLAVIDRDRCKPLECTHECQRFCPGVRMGEETVVFSEDSGDPIISEVLCTGCGICIKKCPYGAITIVNLPEELESDLTHRFGPNAFKLFRLPVVRPGNVTGLIGQNGTGKTTAIKILAGEITPNLGNYNDRPGKSEVISSFKGSELQNYFIKLYNNEIKIAYKPQYIMKLPEVVSGRVSTLLQQVDQRNVLTKLKEDFQLSKVWMRDLKHLSGGELQKVAIAATIAREADLYLFDEPTSYLDVSERLRVSRTIRQLASLDKRVIIVEHDLAALDYLSDYTSVLYGQPGAYGIVSHIHGVRVGINIYLNGFIPDENMRFREQPIRFHTSPTPKDRWVKGMEIITFEVMKKAFKRFTLETPKGELYEGEVVGILGPNGIGKTTFVKMLAGVLEPDDGKPPEEDLTVSYKPQYLQPDFQGTVTDYLLQTVGPRSTTSVFKSETLRPLQIENVGDRPIPELSGGELQRVAIAGCLGRKADLYLLDEPSAFLDVEQRLAVAQTIKRTIQKLKKAAFVVEHDIIVQDFVADRLMIFDGKPGVEGKGHPVTEMRDGMNAFLKQMDVTFRRDAETRRPRVNKLDSRLDRVQKSEGEYYYLGK